MERERDKKREQEDKRRCAYFLLQMIEKYGAIVWEKHMEEEKQEAVSQRDDGKAQD